MNSTCAEGSLPAIDFQKIDAEAPQTPFERFLHRHTQKRGSWYIMSPFFNFKLREASHQENLLILIEVIRDRFIFQ